MPHQQPTRDDLTAQRVLDAVSELIDASLSDSTTKLPSRLRSIRFPPALEWIRIEDVVRITSELNPAISKKAILNRWPTKEELVRDAAIHCITRADPASETPALTPGDMMSRAITFGLSETIRRSAESIMDRLIEHPRHFLLMHLAPMLPRHPEIQEKVAADAARIQCEWAEGYGEVLDRFGVKLRPDWDLERLSLGLQMLLDGNMVRLRVDPTYLRSHARHPSSVFADAVLAMVAGAIDSTGTGLTAAEVIEGACSK